MALILLTKLPPVPLTLPVEWLPERTEELADPWAGAASWLRRALAVFPHASTRQWGQAKQMHPTGNSMSSSGGRVSDGKADTQAVTSVPRSLPIKSAFFCFNS